MLDMKNGRPWAVLAGAALLISTVSACQTPSIHSVTSSPPRALATFPISSPTQPSTSPAQHMSKDADWVQKRYRDIDRDLNGGVDLKKVQVLFVGDSITQFWLGQDYPEQAALWRKDFSDPASPNYALNLGVAGDRTENVLLRLLEKNRGGFGELDNPDLQPKIIVLMIGINNTWHTDGDIVSAVAKGQVAVIRRLRDLRPKAIILVNSLLPTNDEARNESIVIPINRRLAASVARLGKGFVFLDLYPSFLGPDGKENGQLFRDGVHPNTQGYRVWEGQLLPELDRIRNRQDGDGPQ